jgi:post-segregation antitoxin (ccd killing protein)
VIGKERELKSRTKVMDLNVSRKMAFYIRNQYSTMKKKEEHEWNEIQLVQRGSSGRIRICVSRL